MFAVVWCFSETRIEHAEGPSRDGGENVISQQEASANFSILCNYHISSMA